MVKKSYFLFSLVLWMHYSASFAAVTVENVASAIASDAPVKWEDLAEKSEKEIQEILSKHSTPAHIIIPDTILKERDTPSWKAVEELFHYHPDSVAIVDIKKDQWVKEGVLNLATKDIPATIQHLQLINTDGTITAIGDSFLEQAETLQSLSFHNFVNVTTVGKYFLGECSNLRTVDLSSLRNVTTVEDVFLGGCSNLTEIDLTPFTNVKTVGDYFLCGCSNLEMVNLSPLRNVTTVGDYFLLKCSNLTVIDLTPLTNVTTIGNNFLAECSNLKTVDLPPLGNIKTVGDYFLGECSNLTVIDLTPLTNVTTIGNYFLGKCSNLRTVDLSSLRNVKTVGYCFLYCCAQIKKLDLSSWANLESVESGFLTGCNIKTLKLPPFLPQHNVISKLEALEIAKTQGFASAERREALATIRAKEARIPSADYAHLKGASAFQLSRAEELQKEGVAGKGVTIWVLEDAGINEHPAVAQYVNPSSEKIHSIILSTSRDHLVDGHPIIYNIDHGAGVASLIHQIAPEANLIVRYSNSTYDTSEIKRPQIINASFEKSFTTPSTITLQSSFGWILRNIPAPQDQPLVIKAAGNHKQDLSTYPETQGTAHDLLEVIIFAGSLKQGNLPTAYSATPGNDPAIQNRFLWVVGDDLLAAAGARGEKAYNYKGGTSFAAPIISGAAALLKQAFPDFNMKDIAECLLESADQDFFAIDESQILHVGGIEGEAETQVTKKTFDPAQWGKGVLNVVNAYRYGKIKKENPSLPSLEIRQKMLVEIQRFHNKKASSIQTWFRTYKKEVYPPKLPPLVRMTEDIYDKFRTLGKKNTLEKMVGVPYVPWEELLNEESLKSAEALAEVFEKFLPGEPIHILIPEALLADHGSPQRELVAQFFKDHPDYVALFDINKAPFVVDGVLTLAAEAIPTNIQHLRLTNTYGNITTIGDSFLINATTLQSIFFYSFVNLTSIQSGFLFNCPGLTALDLSSFSKLKTIGDFFLYSCHCLPALDLSSFSNVTMIGNFFLSYCHDLKALDLTPLSNVTHIGDSFLMFCVNLNSLDLSALKEIREVGKDFLSECSSLRALQEAIDKSGGVMPYIQALRVRTA